MLTLLIMIVLFVGIYSGVRRGLVLQLIYTAGYIITFFTAHKYYQPFADKLEMLVPYPQPGIGETMPFYSELQVLHLDVAFYNALAFLILIAIGWILTRIIGHMLTSLTFVPVIKQLNSIGGGILGFIMQYAGIFLLLYFLTLIPLDFIQNLLQQSKLATWIISNTPYLSKTIFDWWLGVIS